jgi:uncharacterized membrane protein
VFFKRVGMKPRAPHGPVDRLFELTLLAKAADGVLEVVGGLLLFFTHPARISGLLRAATQHELIHGRHDFIVHHLSRAADHYSANGQWFAALFLLWHGVVKVVLVWALLRRYLWAYPLGIAAFSVFLVYQLYRYSHTHSSWLLALSVLDLAIVVLTWIEYRRMLSLGERSTARGVPDERPPPDDADQQP